MGKEDSAERKKTSQIFVGIEHLGLLQFS